MKLVELTDTLVSLLRNEIPSPHSSGNWIYSDYPRIDATFPRISLTQTSGALTAVAIGECTESGKTGELMSISFDIDIWVKVTDKYTSLTTPPVMYVGSKLREYYADLILSALEAEKETLRADHGIIDIGINSITTAPLDEEHLLHRKTITIEVTFVWEHD